MRLLNQWISAGFNPRYILNKLFCSDVIVKCHNSDNWMYFIVFFFITNVHAFFSLWLKKMLLTHSHFL